MSKQSAIKKCVSLKEAAQESGFVCKSNYQVYLKMRTFLGFKKFECIRKNLYRRDEKCVWLFDYIHITITLT